MSRNKRIADTATPVALLSPSDVPQTVAEPIMRGGLSNRERQCIELLAQGNSNAQIAGLLSISQPTVSLHLANARRKLGAITREHAVALAISRGLISL